MRPDPGVLASFGGHAEPVPLPGGEGTAWRAGEVVLKPAGDPADWAGVSPLWPRLITASRAFHAALAGRPAPPWLGRDGSPWTAGDQVAWGERDPGSVLAAAPGPLAGQLRGLLAALRPVRLPSQLIHGDLGGNVLFSPASPPAVIDFSPYWRPAGLALAVAAVDALTWGGADPAILGELDGEPEIGQLLARAHVGRLVTEVVSRRGDQGGLDTVARTGRPVTVLILARLALG